MPRPLPSPAKMAASGLQKNRRVAGKNPLPPIPYDPPKGIMGRYGREEWRRHAAIQHELSENGDHWITASDLALFAGYCQAFEEWRLASESTQKWVNERLKRHREAGNEYAAKAPATRIYEAKGDGEGGVDVQLAPMIRLQNRLYRHMKEAANAVMLGPVARQRLNLIMVADLKTAVGESGGLIDTS